MGSAALVVILIRIILAEPFNIPSASMVPTMLIGDYLLVSKSSYGYSRFSIPFGLINFDGRLMASQPQRGDVAVFRNPRDLDSDYIKRVIGLPGDHIQMKLGRLYINGVIVDRQRIEDFSYEAGNGLVMPIPQFEETLPGGVRHRILEMEGDKGSLDNTPLFIVPAGHYFMMGDNRDNSLDSRVDAAVGMVPVDNFIGKAWLRFWSIGPDVHWYNPISWFSGLRRERLFTLINKPSL